MREKGKETKLLSTASRGQLHFEPQTDVLKAGTIIVVFKATAWKLSILNVYHCIIYLMFLIFALWGTVIEPPCQYRVTGSQCKTIVNNSIILGFSAWVIYCGCFGCFISGCNLGPSAWIRRLAKMVKGTNYISILHWLNMPLVFAL